MFHHLFQNFNLSILGITSNSKEEKHSNLNKKYYQDITSVIYCLQ